MPPSGASTTCASRLSHGTALERSRGGAHPHETDEWSGGVFGIGGGGSQQWSVFHELARFSVTRCESVRMPLASCQPFSRESWVLISLSRPRRSSATHDRSQLRERAVQTPEISTAPEIVLSSARPRGARAGSGARPRVAVSPRRAFKSGFTKQGVPYAPPQRPPTRSSLAYNPNPNQVAQTSSGTVAPSSFRVQRSVRWPRPTPTLTPNPNPNPTQEAAPLLALVAATAAFLTFRYLTLRLVVTQHTILI